MKVQHTEIVDFAEQFKLNETDVLTAFEQERGWQNKYRRIMLIGKQLPDFQDSWQQENAKVQGCESDVWLYLTWDDEQTPAQLKVAASSNAKIVRGLVAIVLAGFNNKTREQILQFDVNDYFDQLALLEHLSPSRGNGIRAIIAAIQNFVQD